jgi:hypothetical protein
MTGRDRGRLRRGLLRGSIIVILAAATAAAHHRMEGSRKAGREEARAALAGVLSPGEMAAATLLGGFRSIAIDIAWIRVMECLDEQRYEDLPILYEVLEVFQTRSPLLFLIEADQMVLDLPRRLPHRPEERRAWIGKGLETIERGLARFPDHPLLLREKQFLYFLRFDPRRYPDDRAWFLAARPGPRDRVPYGVDPLRVARSAGEKALSIPEHTFDIDEMLWRVYRLSYGLVRGEEGAGGEPPEGLAGEDYLGLARRLILHAEEAHRDVPAAAEFIRVWREQLEGEARAR